MALSLSKREEKFALSLSKKSITKIIACVGCAFDVSGSMDNEYRDGLMTEFCARLMPLGLRFDDNGEIDNWAFDSGVYDLGPITKDNYETYIQSTVQPLVGGSTNFAPMLRSVYDHYFKGRTETKTNVVKKGFFGFGSKTETETITHEAAAGDKPVYFLVQTDGENYDKSETERLLAQLEKTSIYIQFVGIGTDTTFQFIKDMGDKFSNVGFFHVPNLSKISDDELYANLINDEFKQFMQSKFPNYITVG